MNKNKVVVKSRPFPVKLLYLKDKKPQNISENNLNHQKPSLAHLSSIIQDQKQHSIKSYHSHQINHNTTQKIYHSQKKHQFQYSMQLPTTSNKHQLINILGDQWDSFNNHTIFQTLQRSKKRKSKNKRYSTTYDNKNTLRNGFDIFIKKNEQKSQQKLNLTNVVEAIYHRSIIAKQKIQLQPNNFKDMFRKVESKSTRTRQKKNSKIINTIMAKKNFKTMQNFNWTKIIQTNFNINHQEFM